MFCRIFPITLAGEDKATITSHSLANCRNSTFGFFFWRRLTDLVRQCSFDKGKFWNLHSVLLCSTKYRSFLTFCVLTQFRHCQIEKGLPSDFHPPPPRFLSFALSCFLLPARRSLGTKISQTILFYIGWNHSFNFLLVFFFHISNFFFFFLGQYYFTLIEGTVLTFCLS